MTTADSLMVLVVLAGPIIAVRITRYLDDQKEVRERKVWIFKTLMATRAANLSTSAVQALNSIDLEFDSSKPNEKRVIDAWKAYLDLLNDTSIPPEQWGVRRRDLFVDLLHEMSRVLKFNFDKTTIKNSVYAPQAHGQIEDDNTAIRRGLRDMIEGRGAIPIQLVNANEPQAETDSEEETDSAKP